MPKGYWIPQIDVSNPEGYKAYMAATPPAHEKYHGVALVRGGKMEVVEGRARTRCVLREFPDYATALTCYRSAEYQRARPLRLPHSVCDFVVVEGYDRPRPQTKKAIGSSRSMYLRRKPTSHISLPTRRRSGSSARAILCVGASARSWRARRAVASSFSNFPATAPRLPVIIHPDIAPPRKSAPAT